MKKIYLFLIPLVLASASAKASNKTYDNDFIVKSYTDIKNYINKKNETRKYKGLEGLYLNFGYAMAYTGSSDNIFVSGGDLSGVTTGGDYATSKNFRDASNRYDNFYVGLMYAININNYIIAPEINKYIVYSGTSMGNYSNYKINFGLDLSDNSTLLFGFGLSRSKQILTDGYNISNEYDWHFLFEPAFIYRFNEKYAVNLSVKLERDYNYEATNKLTSSPLKIQYDMTTYNIGFMYKF